MDYRTKYLKYKNKYIILKHLYGGMDFDESPRSSTRDESSERLRRNAITSDDADTLSELFGDFNLGSP